MVSSNYNEGIARIVAKTIHSVGVNGTVSLVESPTGETSFCLVRGLLYDRGYVTEAFVSPDHKQELMYC